MNVLVLSASASAINVALSLRDHVDVRLFLTDANGFASGLYLPWVEARLVPRADAVDAYRRRLDDIIRTDAIDAVLATSDADIRAVVGLRAQGWKPPVAMFTPNPEILELMASKRRLPVRVRELGFTAPRVYAGLKDAEPPVVLKPTHGSGAKGVVIARDQASLETAWSELQASYGDFVCQQYIAGGRGDVYVVMLLFDNEGAMRANVVSRSTLTFMTWGGGGNAGEIVDEPSLAKNAASIVEALGGWRGPINLEFIREDATDRFYLMEINCRLNGYSYLFTMNGLDFPSMIIDLLRDQRIESPATREPRRNFVLGFREEPVAEWITR